MANPIKKTWKKLTTRINKNREMKKLQKELAAKEKELKDISKINKKLDSIEKNPNLSSAKKEKIIQEAKDFIKENEKNAKRNERNNKRNTHSTEENPSSPSTTQDNGKAPNKNLKNKETPQGQKQQINNTANNPFLPRNFSVNTQNQRLQRNQNYAPFQQSKLANEIKRPDSPLTPTRRDDLKNAFSSLDKEFNSFQESLEKSRSWTKNKRDEKYNAINSSSENRTKDKELVPQTPKSRQPSPSLGNRPKF
ncbi:MAG: hypothetical protein E7275_00370 [Pseudobutyrivibrio sp.]|uniref:hypothetical protein n=1 Tax=Pseudobutyrivibrio sp. TaxID=2014367 RepID=UPI0025D30C3E|nr:hypothetical protein [Pseudobutyrivibrio sp.]MBE5902713.1 hypothetical protein [Pseudobutyrivibrio sp.]